MANSARTNLRTFESRQNTRSRHSDVPASAIEQIPDGGYEWTVVFACLVVTFTVNGWSGSCGLLQTALSQTYPGQESTTSLSFLGSLSIALCVELGLACIRLSQLIGARQSMLIGVLLMSFGSMSSSFTVSHHLPARWLLLCRCRCQDILWRRFSCLAPCNNSIIMPKSSHI